MSLESYSQEARRLLASFLSSLLDAPGHWYAPMLPDDHPSSFCKLTGLASGELCLVLEASDFVVKQGKNKNSYSLFWSDAFNGFLQSPQLQSIDKSVSQPSILKCKRHWAYLIGKTSGDTYLSAVLHLAIECQRPSSPCRIFLD
jgi:hypothetical protein